MSDGIVRDKEIMPGVCPKCDKGADYVHLGDQDGDQITEHWRCSSCGSSLIFRYSLESVYHDDSQTIYEQHPITESGQA